MNLLRIFVVGTHDLFLDTAAADVEASNQGRSDSFAGCSQHPLLLSKGRRMSETDGPMLTTHEGDVPAVGEHRELKVQETEIDRVNRRHRRIIIVSLLGGSLLLAVIVGLAIAFSQRSGGEDGQEAEPQTALSEAPSYIPTYVPTMAPSYSPELQNRFNSIVQLIIDSGASTAKNLNTPLSPQNRAVRYMVEQEGLAPNSARTLEAYAALVLYYSTNGPDWKDQLNFTNPMYTDVCDWNGVNNLTSGEDAQGIMCVNGTVVTVEIGTSCLGTILETLNLIDFLFLIFCFLVIVQNRMGGRLPSELQLFRDLAHLNLHSNSIHGTIPSSLRLLTKLTYLGLHHNGLTGSFPAWITELSDLRGIGLGNNLLEGSFPIGMGEMTKLQILATDDNLMTGNIDFITDLTDMRFLYLEDNAFYGTVNSSFVRHTFFLEHLDISNNRLTGSVPSHVFRTPLLPRLRVLDLHGNNLGGTLPRLLLVNRVLQFLSLHNNPLTGSIPDSIDNLSMLTHLDLTSTGLTGVIPPFFGLLSRLEYLFLANNPSLAPGPFPTQLGSMFRLRDVSMANTSLTGTIPSLLGTRVLWRRLDLSGNALNGTIPSELGRMRSLAFLLLHDNQLSGLVPPELDQLTQLRRFSMTSTTGDPQCVNGVKLTKRSLVS